MPRRLLFLDANRLSAYSWQGGQLQAEREFTADANGVADFDAYLAEHTDSVFSILADVAEEGFQMEDVPYVTGRDRSALTARRLAQYFYGTSYSLAISLGREKSGRRDEKVLFAALTQPRHFDAWLAAMRHNGVQLAGLYSAPQAIASLLATHKMAGPKLVLTITRSGVRQTFFHDGKLQFSRLAVLATGGLEEAAIACAVEAQKIYQYLAGQRQVQRNSALEVLILAHPAQFGIIRAHCHPSAELNFDYIDLLAESKSNKLKSVIADSHCDLLLLHELVHRPPAQQFAPPEERHFYRLWQIRSGLTAAAAVVFLACLLFAGKQYFSAHALNEATLTFDSNRQADQAKYDRALQALPQLPINTEDMRTLVARFEDMANRSPLLETTLIPLSHALDATPGIELQRIDWQLTDKLPTPTTMETGSLKQPSLSISGSYYVVAEIQAQLPVALINDHRAMLQLINQFVAELDKQKTLGVQMTQLPFDVESGKTIKSSDDASSNQAEAPKFSLRLIQGF